MPVLGVRVPLRALLFNGECMATIVLTPSDLADPDDVPILENFTTHVQMLVRSTSSKDSVIYDDNGSIKVIKV